MPWHIPQAWYNHHGIVITLHGRFQPFGGQGLLHGTKHSKLQNDIVTQFRKLQKLLAPELCTWLGPTQNFHRPLESILPGVASHEPALCCKPLCQFQHLHLPLFVQRGWEGKGNRNIMTLEPQHNSIRMCQKLRKYANELSVTKSVTTP